MRVLLKRIVQYSTSLALLLCSSAFAVDGTHVNGFSVAVHSLPINYVSMENGQGAGPIVRYDIASGAVTGHDTIFHDIAQRAAISLDGTRIAFFRWGWRIGAKDGSGQYSVLAGTSNAPCYVSVINKDGTGLKNLTQLPCLGAVGYPAKHPFDAWDAHLDWPAGDWIYYEMPNKTGIIRRVNARTGADNFVVAYLKSNEKGYQSWDSGDGAMRRWSISVDGKWEAHQSEIGQQSGSNEFSLFDGSGLGFTNFPPPEGAYGLCPVGGLSFGCNHSISASGNFVGNFFAGCHDDAQLGRFPHDQGWLDGNGLSGNSIAHVTFTKLQQWTGQNIFSQAEWIMWAANSDKWISVDISPTCGNGEFAGINQVLANWVDNVAIVTTGNTLSNGEKSDFGDFWVSDPVNNPLGNKYEDETGVWHAVAPIDPDTNAVTAAFTIRDNTGRRHLMGFSLGKDIGVAPCAVKLDGRYSVGKNLTYQWNFGDGTTGAGDTLHHTYAVAGEYTVVLTVSNGSTQSQKSRIISVATPSQVPVNVSQGKTATASTGGDTASKAVDGDWGTVCKWQTTSPLPVRLSVDLGSVQSFQRIIVLWYNSWECASVRSYTVDISSDNSSWTTIATKGPTQTVLPGSLVPDTVNTDQSARYVRVNVTSISSNPSGQNNVWLKELQVFRVAQGPFLNPATGSAARFEWNPAANNAMDVSTTHGRVGLVFGTPARRAISLFAVNGSVLARGVSNGIRSSLSLDAASGSIVIARVMEKGKNPIVRRIAVR
jgi:PKD repeat protein